MKNLWILLFSIFFIQCTEGNNTDQTQENSSDVYKSNSGISFTVDILAENLENPWGLEFLPDGRVLICERPGRLRIFENGRLSPRPVDGLPEVWAHGQGGLLDVVMHPDYENNGWLYIAYSALGQGNRGNLAISRARLDGNRLVDVEKIFHGQPFTDRRHHFGTRLVFDDDGYLFFAIGDRGQQDFAQNLNNHNGKVLRINDDGSVPDDNPFVGQAEALPEIWAFGSRNIQGMAIHPVSRDIWSHEHGPKGGDEINIVQKGVNYAWPKATFGVNYNGTVISEHTTWPGTSDPLHVWTPSIAPCGMDFVTSDRYPQWENNILIGALAGQHIHRLELDGDEVVGSEKLLQGFARFRQVKQGPDGYIYVLTEGPGLFFRLVPQ